MGGNTKQGGGSQLGKSGRRMTPQEGVVRQVMQADGRGHNAWDGQMTQGEQVGDNTTRGEGQTSKECRRLRTQQEVWVEDLVNGGNGGSDSCSGR